MPRHKSCSPHTSSIRFTEGAEACQFPLRQPRRNTVGSRDRPGDPSADDSTNQPPHRSPIRKVAILLERRVTFTKIAPSPKPGCAAELPARSATLPRLSRPCGSVVPPQALPTAVRIPRNPELRRGGHRAHPSGGTPTESDRRDELALTRSWHELRMRTPGRTLQAPVSD